MTFSAFYLNVIRRSLHRAKEWGHLVHFLIVLGTGAFVLVGWHLSEHELIALPFLALLFTFLFGVFWYAYAMYREERGARVAQEQEIEDLQAKLAEAESNLQTKLAEAERKHQAAKASDEQKALSHAEFHKLRQQLCDLLQWSNQGRPRSGPNHALAQMEQDFVASMRDKLLGWLESARKEAEKVGLSGYLARTEEIGPLNDIYEVDKFIARQQTAVDVILQRVN